jgi:hypothetical protein
LIFIIILSEEKLIFIIILSEGMWRKILPLLGVLLVNGSTFGEYFWSNGSTFDQNLKKVLFQIGRVIISYEKYSKSTPEYFFWSWSTSGQREYFWSKGVLMVKMGVLLAKMVKMVKIE